MVRVDIDAFFVTLSFLIFFDHLFIAHFWVFTIDPRCCIYWNFPYFILAWHVKGGMNNETSSKNADSFHCLQFFLNSGFTWMECRTTVCHNIAEAGIYKNN